MKLSFRITTPFALALSVVLLAVGCTTTASYQSSGLTRPVDDYMAAWNAHDAGKAAGFLDDKVEYFDATTSQQQVGRRNAQKNIIQTFMTAVPDLTWRRDTTVAPISSHDAIAFQWTLAGTNTGNWPDGAKATGRKFTIRGATLMRFKDGKIIYQGDYYDAYGFYKQLGLVQ